MNRNDEKNRKTHEEFSPTTDITNESNKSLDEKLAELYGQRYVDLLNEVDAIVSVLHDDDAKRRIRKLRKEIQALLTEAEHCLTRLAQTATIDWDEEPWH